MGVNVRKMLVAVAFGAAAIAASLTPALASGRVALVIGNGNYAELGTLGNPTNDADDIAATLRGMGFQVVAKDNVDGRTFTGLLSDFSTAAADADVALFYYSGHGLQYKSENYLVPIDATLENRFSLTHETIPLADVQAALSGARTALIYIDACRSFPIQGTFLASANERVTPVKGLAPVERIDNTFVGFSASAGQTASDGHGRNSPFTTAMLEMLPKPGLDVGAMFNAVDGAGRILDRRQPEAAKLQRTHDRCDAGGCRHADQLVGARFRRAGLPRRLGNRHVGAYRAFVARFPGGFYSELAREALNKLQDGEQHRGGQRRLRSKPSVRLSPRPSLTLPGRAQGTGPQLLRHGDPDRRRLVDLQVGCWLLHGRHEAAGVSPGGLALLPAHGSTTRRRQATITSQSSMFTGGNDGGYELVQERHRDRACRPARRHFAPDLGRVRGPPSCAW